LTTAGQVKLSNQNIVGQIRKTKTFDLVGVNLFIRK